jgi:menaquinone-specific isochorismate synthase
LVAILETELKRGIEQAIEKARKMSVPILVSEVQTVDHIEPLSFFAAGKEQFLGERFFWKDPTDETFLIGLGVCMEIQSEQASDRFTQVENEWNHFIKDALIIREQVIKGTGPVLFGGFSFDPLKEKTPLWIKYSDSLFHIPKYLLTVVNGKSYLTTNLVCTQHDDISTFVKTGQERQKLLSYTNQTIDLNLSQPISEKEVVNPDIWKQTVQNLVGDLKNEELKKVVLARELRLLFKDKVSIEAVLNNLIKEQRESFTFAFESNGDCFIGASPERLVKKEGMKLFSTCLAGSIARGKTDDEDSRLGEILLNDEKNLIEHHYVVEMIKEAMEEVCGDVSIPEHPSLLKMRDIQHLYTPVVGIANQDSSLLQVVDALHPTPALGGLPKREAVEKIRNIEKLDRGFYAAPIGWLDYEGNGEFAVAIRSALVQGNEASLFAGCGIVKDSDAESEYVETRIKFRPMLSALGGLNK